MATVKITNRIKPCRCGCVGSDPWHAPSFERALRNLSHIPTDHAALLAQSKDRRFNVVIATATAKFPSGDVEVQHIRLYSHGLSSDMGWAREGVWTVGPLTRHEATVAYLAGTTDDYLD